MVCGLFSTVLRPCCSSKLQLTVCSPLSSHNEGFTRRRTEDTQRLAHMFHVYTKGTTFVPSSALGPRRLMIGNGALLHSSRVPQNSQFSLASLLTFCYYCCPSVPRVHSRWASLAASPSPAAPSTL